MNADLQYPLCKECGTVVARGSNLCAKCRSKKLLPQCDYFEERTEGYFAIVPWCNKDDTPCVTKKGLKCRWCKENKRSD